MTTWEIYFVLFYLFRNRLSKNLIKNSIIILFYVLCQTIHHPHEADIHIRYR